MTEALPRTRPRIQERGELDRVVRRLVKALQPLAIYLFGSRARGDASDDSDYDLMLVLKDDSRREDCWKAVREVLKGARVDANPFLTRATAFAWRHREVGTLEYEAAVDGIRLYPRSGADLRVDGERPTEHLPMNVKVIAEWLRRVEHDLVAARKCNEGDDAVPDQVAYHTQQAAEKLTKAALVAYRRRPRKGHQIQKFTPLLPEGFPLKSRFPQLERFSDYAWAHRYPEYPDQRPLPEPSVADACEWLAEVAALKADFERWLEARARKP